MKKLVLATLLAAAGVSGVQAQTKELGYGNLQFEGSVTKSGCTIYGGPSQTTGVGALAIHTVDMPAQFGSSKLDAVPPTTTAPLAFFDSLKDEVKYSTVQGAYVLSIECPNQELADYLAPPTVAISALLNELDTGSQLYLLPNKTGGSGVHTTTAGATLFALKAVPSSAAADLGIAVKRLQGDIDYRAASISSTPVVFTFKSPVTNPGGNVTDTNGEKLDLKWKQDGTDPLDLIKTKVYFDFAYVKAGTAVTGSATHNLPFVFQYK